jgi:BMFP domain-containing protein YqiC
VGLIWDLIQQGQIGNARQRAETLEERVRDLEAELRRTNDVMMRLLHALEHRFGQDLDGDNRIG